MKKLFTFLTINLFLSCFAAAQPYSLVQGDNNTYQNIKNWGKSFMTDMDPKLNAAVQKAQQKKPTTTKISVASVYNSYSYQNMSDADYISAVINNYSALQTNMGKHIDKLAAKAEAWPAEDEQGKRKIVTEKCDLQRELSAIQYLGPKVYIPIWSMHEQGPKADKKVRKALTKSIGEKGLAYMMVMSTAVKGGNLKAYYTISKGFFKHFYPESYD